ncbi:MAG: aminotransferase class V-fold PLP-dependent enzyme, partial [Myxococcales bacterium]|nr:aminotransferase class V-fold PLP-dependent enzyme [Myxococcales bacterium]
MTAPKPFDPTPFRRHFPVLENLLFFNHAAVAPLPQPAVDAMRGFLDDSSRWASIHEAPDWTRRHREVRALFARLVGGEPHEVAYVKNTTEGLGFVAAGLDWRAGDNVVWLEGKYPSNVYPWWHLGRLGVEARMVPQRPGARFDVDDIVSAIGHRTRLVAVSSVEFSTGFRNDLDAIGAACRERGVLFCVDAIQSLGALRLDVRETPVDFLSADGHKWLLSPEGIGAFWASDRVIDQLTPAYIGWMSVLNAGNFDVLDATLKPHAGKFEGGTLNTIGIYGFGAA